jgi:hypothetical protein
MPCSTPRLVVGTLVLVLVACERPAPTAVSHVPHPTVPTDLTLAAPLLTQDDLTAVSIVTHGERPSSGLMLSEGGEDEGLVPATIYTATTRVGFQEGLAYAEGSMEYAGHVGRVETTANVAFENQHLGESTAIEQESSWASLDTRRHVFAFAYVRTDKTCGLSVFGASEHAAWWELFQVKNAPTFGRVEASSQAGPASQPACGKHVTNENPDTWSTGDGLTCTYLITYDLDTLEVLQVELLYCSSGGGVLF